MIPQQSLEPLKNGKDNEMEEITVNSSEKMISQSLKQIRSGEEIPS